MREIILDKAFPGAAPGAVRTDVINAADEPDYGRSIGVGVILGLMIGTVLGVVMLLYVNSPQLNQWPGTPFLVLSSSLGWALFGMIAGGGGVFSDVGKRIFKKA